MTDDAEQAAAAEPVGDFQHSDQQSADQQGAGVAEPQGARVAGAPVEGEEPTPKQGRTERDGERTLGRDLLAASVLAVVLTALGFPYAMLWQIITPRVEYVTVEGGWSGVVSHDDRFVEGDLMFAGLGLVLGILAAIMAWSVMRERRGPIVMLGLVIGSIACQVVAWRIGLHEWESFWEAIARAPIGVHMWRPPSVLFVNLDPAAAWDDLMVGHFTAALANLQLGALAVMALAAVFTYTVSAGWSRRSNLRSHVPE
ncbi:DUF2567 domain-containing protein [Glycomyces buryatensis]|uniref:DUF2567 domain-containing protein n=1 Tax=Glycomyces buryatensis TaxID=2570927 RepID=A0A4S8Q607_9ACTN|nr:DUF2567 domain-containing protein [Glycomyces buryatensis]THV39530.1 DUF2567 domain-containing protein [Glycomyces buryatensis]